MEKFEDVQQAVGGEPESELLETDTVTAAPVVGTPSNNAVGIVPESMFPSRATVKDVAVVDKTEVMRVEGIDPMRRLFPKSSVTRGEVNPKVPLLSKVPGMAPVRKFLRSLRVKESEKATL